MAKVKDWLIDMEYHVFNAYENGINDINEIVRYCRKQMSSPVDESYIREVYDNLENNWGC